jgi:hypothetical protein
MSFIHWNMRMEDEDDEVVFSDSNDVELVEKVTGVLADALVPTGEVLAEGLDEVALVADVLVGR